jgi:hypothetical protein
MLSDKRGIIKQEDIINSNNKIINNKIIDNKIIQDYKSIKFELDTYTITKNKVTLYFPK